MTCYLCAHQPHGPDPDCPCVKGCPGYRMTTPADLVARWRGLADGYDEDDEAFRQCADELESVSMSEHSVAEQAVARMQRVLDDETANLADDGARLSHPVVRRMQAALCPDDAEGSSVDHQWTPGKFSGRCQVMLARYRCPYPAEAHPSTPPSMGGGR